VQHRQRQYFGLILIAVLTVIAIPRIANAQDTPISMKPNLPAKKFIEYGWDDFNAPDPMFIRDHISEMEKHPFEGMVFRLANNGGEVFNLSAWQPEKLEPQIAVLKSIKWNKFTDNFLALYATSTMGWFSDADWDKVLAHARFCARAAKAARCKGIMFDPEPYGGDRDVWYNGTAKVKSGRPFSEYIAQARKRGSQFMNALQSEMPDIEILSLYSYQRFYHFYHGEDAAKRNATLNGDGFALLAAFYDGMLQVAGGNVRLIDGNEQSYYYTSPGEFYRAYIGMRHGAKVYAAADVRGQYDCHVRASQALYVDYIFSLRPDIWKNIPSVQLSPQERLRYFEYNAYYALQASDEYVWVYGENMNWWKNENIPSGLEESMISAQKKVDFGEPLGFKLSSKTLKEESSIPFSQTK
jgi:hypothetical protein